MAGCEQYFDLFSTTVGGGGYTAGSGVLDVVSTTGVTLNAGDTCRLLVYRVSGGVNTPIVLLIATAVNSGTQFAVTSEGADSNAIATDVVINVNSVGGQNQIRKDQSGLAAYSSLPSTSSAHVGDRFSPTDADSNYAFVFNGSIWVPRLATSQNVTIPPAAASWSWIGTQGSALITDLASGGVQLTNPTTTQTAVALAVPGSTPWTRRFGFNWMGGGIGGGLFFYDSGSARAQVFHHEEGSDPDAVSSSKRLEFFSISNWHIAAGVWTFDSQVIAPVRIAANSPLFYMALEDDGTNFLFLYGIDLSSNLLQFSSSQGRHSWLSGGPTHYGFLFYSQITSAPIAVNLLHLG
jgi:hypothetical protein